LHEIHSAAYDGDPDQVRICLARGDAVDGLDASGHTPLLWACFRGLVGDQVAVAAVLIAAEADVNAHIQPRGRSCLQLACQSSNQPLVELLLDSGADPGLVADELSPLMFALRCREESIARLLIERRADCAYRLHGRTAADYADCEGFTALAALIRTADPVESSRICTGPDAPPAGTIGA
jgi:ankyrin repeat protein